MPRSRSCRRSSSASPASRAGFAALVGKLLGYSIPMSVAGFSTVTITSVIVTSIIAGRIGSG